MAYHLTRQKILERSSEQVRSSIEAKYLWV
jgi:hypothetical protein